MDAPPPFFDDRPFVYDRTQPPLFVVLPQDATEEQQRQLILNRASREYFRASNQAHQTHLSVMSMGMTLGEYSMMLLLQKNRQRRGR